MNVTDFKQLISVYGSDPRRWPAEQREPGLAFMQHNEAHAAHLLQDEQKLDAMLALCDAQEPSDLLKGRILKNLPSQQQDYTARHSLASPGWSSVAAMVLVAFGLGFGGANLMPDAAQPVDPSILVASIDGEEGQILQTADELGFSDVYYWVQGEDVNAMASGI